MGEEAAQLLWPACSWGFETRCQAQQAAGVVGLHRAPSCSHDPGVESLATGLREPCGAGGESRLGPDLRAPCCLPDQHILRDLEKKKILVFTPSRRVGGKRVVCYDDRFIVKLAFESDGIVVSNDTYRDLQGERQEWKRFIEERLLMYSFVNDKYVPPLPEGLRGGTRPGRLCG